MDLENLILMAFDTSSRDILKTLRALFAHIWPLLSFDQQCPQNLKGTGGF
jgi:hypothetical protein